MASIKNVKKAYSQSEWNLREDYYIDEVSKIVIPEAPSTQEIKKLNSQIDALLTEVLGDVAYVKRQYDEYDRMMKLAEKEAFNAVKSAPGQGSGIKLTEKDTVSLVVTYLRSNPLSDPNANVDPKTGKRPPMKVDIYSAVQIYEKRLRFIEAVSEMLEGKKSALVTDNAMLKIEAGIQ